MCDLASCGAKRRRNKRDSLPDAAVSDALILFGYGVGEIGAICRHKVWKLEIVCLWLARFDTLTRVAGAGVAHLAGVYETALYLKIHFGLQASMMHAAP